MSDTGYGATLSLAGDVIGKTRIIDPPEYVRDLVEVTHLGSADETKEYIGGLNDWEPLTFETLAEVVASGDATNNYDTILSNLGSDTPVAVVYTWPNGATLSFNGWITRYKAPRAEATQEQVSTVTIKPTAKPAFADAA